MGIYSELAGTIESATTHFATNHSQALAEAIFPYVSSGLVFWFMLMGYEALAGKLQEPLTNFLWRCGSIAFLTAIAFAPSIYQGEILANFDDFQNRLISALAEMQTTPYQVADAALDQGFTLAGVMMGQASILDVGSWTGPALGSLIIYAGTAVLTFMVAGNIIVTKAGLALVLAFGQVAIACLIFPPTRKVFDGFIEDVLTSIATIGMMTAVMALGMEIFAGVIGSYDRDTTNGLVFAFKLLVSVALCVSLIHVAVTKAAKLCGRISAGLVNPIMAAAKTATAAPVGLARYATGQTSRTNAVTGEQELSSRASHLLRGNSMLNPAYRQKAMERMQSGWGAASGGSTTKGEPKSSSQKLKDMDAAMRQREQSKRK